VQNGIRLGNLGGVGKQTIRRQMEVMFLDPTHFLKVCSSKKKTVVFAKWWHCHTSFGAQVWFLSSSVTWGHSPPVGTLSRAVQEVQP